MRGLWVDAYDETFEGQLQILSGLLRSPQTTDEQKKSLKAVIVGNEAYFRQEQTIPQLIRKIRKARATLGDISGLSHVKFSTADVPWIYYDMSLVNEVDFLIPNLHVFFANYSIEHAPFMFWRAFEAMEKNAMKEIVIGETGWPSGGHPWRPDRISIPSARNAAYFFNRLSIIDFQVTPGLCQVYLRS